MWKGLPVEQPFSVWGPSHGQGRPSATSGRPRFHLVRPRTRGDRIQRLCVVPHSSVNLPVSCEGECPDLAVSDRRGRGPPPVAPDGRSSTRCGSTPWATGPDGHQGPVGEGRTPPGQLPRRPKAPSAFNRLNAPHSSAGQPTAKHASCAACRVGRRRNMPISWPSSWAGPDGRSGAP